MEINYNIKLQQFYIVRNILYFCVLFANGVCFGLLFMLNSYTMIDIVLPTLCRRTYFDYRRFLQQSLCGFIYCIMRLSNLFT